MTRPGQPIFVTGPGGDRAGPGGPLLYVILGRPNPTRYDAMTPGVVTGASTQREIVSALGRTDVRVVIRVSAPGAGQATTAVAKSSTSTSPRASPPTPATGSTRC